MTSSTSPITAMRPSARVLITLLAALSLVFSQLVGFAASAEEVTEDESEDAVPTEAQSEASQGDEPSGGDTDTSQVDDETDPKEQTTEPENDPSDSSTLEFESEAGEGSSIQVNETSEITPQSSGVYVPTGINGTAYTGTATQYVEAGNPSCSTLGGKYGISTAGEIKFDPGPSAGASIEQDGITVTITDRYTTRNGVDGLFFDYTVTGGTVLSAFMKQGNGGMFYLYGAPGVTGDEGLHSQEKEGSIWADVSHISFCYDSETPSPGVSIVKSVDDTTPAADGSFTYTLDVDSDGQDGATATGVTVTDFIDLLGGQLTIEDIEIVDALDGQTCSTTTNGDGDVDLSCSLGDMVTGDTAQITITINVPSDIADICEDVVTNTADVTADGDLSDSSEETTVTMPNCPEPDFIVIRVEKEFIDIDEDDEPAFRVDLTTDPDFYDRLSDQFAVLAEVNGAHTSSVEGDGEDRTYDSTWWESERYVPLASDGTYEVTETGLPSGFRVVSGEGEFDYNAGSDSLQCSGEPDFQPDRSLVSVSEGPIHPIADIYCTHTVVNEEIPPVVTSTPRNPEIDIVKSAVSADVDFEFVNDVLTVTLEQGETAEITYEYVITNEGNESLDTLGLDDDVIGDLTDEFVAAVDEEYNSATFPVNGEVTVTATYTTTAADLTAGTVTNVATVTGTGFISNDDVDAEDDETINIIEVRGEIEVTPDISIVKSAVDGVREAEDGTLEVVFGPGTSSKAVTYEFVITNTGEDDLTALTLMDDKIGDLSEAFLGAVITAHGAAILPVGGSVTVTAIHDVELGDFANGTLTNVATVSGIGVESEGTVTDNDDETVVSIEVLGETEEDPPVTPVVDTTETVTAEQHPRTGFDTGALTSLGLLLAAIGAGVLLLGRRREEGDLS